MAHVLDSEFGTLPGAADGKTRLNPSLAAAYIEVAQFYSEALTPCIYGQTWTLDASLIPSHVRLPRIDRPSYSGEAVEELHSPDTTAVAISATAS